MKSLLVCLLLVALATAAPSGRPRFMRGRNKIVGGTAAAPGEIPFQISLQDTSFGLNFHFCGGSIYADNVIITAAQCVEGDDFENPVDFRIVAGDTDRKVEEGTEQAVKVARIILNEDYDKPTFSNDIALIFIESPLSFDDYVQAVVLPAPGQVSSGDARVSGWGASNVGDVTSDTLQVVTVPIVSDDACRDVFGAGDVLDSMICAGGDGLNSCLADTGGPMICTSGGATYQCGIVSWGYDCDNPQDPVVYTEVSYFVDWIESNARFQK